MKLDNKKSLVAFFSHTGENYAVGNIHEGNTHIVANYIAEGVGANLFEIKPVKPYPQTYDQCKEQAEKELAENARPALIADCDLTDYEVVFIGFPEWCDEPPMPVMTFLDAHDWKGKIVVPFTTHEGSGFGKSLKSVADSVKGATMLKGFAIEGKIAQLHREKTMTAVDKWLKDLGYTIIPDFDVQSHT